jgi:hypothetical protein
MPQQRLHTPQIRTMLDHMGRTAMPQFMWTRPSIRRPHHLPNPLPRQWISTHTQKQRPLHASLHQPRPPQRQISFQSLHRTPSQRNNPLLIALPSHLRPSHIQMQILHPQRTNLPYPQPTRIKQLQNRMIPQRQPIRIRRPSRHAGLFQHLSNLAFGKALRQYLPASRSLHIHRRIMLNPLIHQQPPVKPAQTAQLPRNRPRLHTMPSQPFHKPTHIGLRSPHQQPIPSLNMLRTTRTLPEAWPAPCIAQLSAS